MLRDRKVWLTLRALENAAPHGNHGAGQQEIPINALIGAVLAKNKSWFSWPRFRYVEDVQRSIDSLSGQGQWVWHSSTVAHHIVTPTIKTEARGDSYFPFFYFWPKLVDAIGFGKILGTIALVLSFVPNGLGWMIVDRILPHDSSQKENIQDKLLIEAIQELSHQVNLLRMQNQKD